MTLALVALAAARLVPVLEAGLEETKTKQAAAKVPSPAERAADPPGLAAWPGEAWGEPRKAPAEPDTAGAAPRNHEPEPAAMLQQSMGAFCTIDCGQCDAGSVLPKDTGKGKAGCQLCGAGTFNMQLTCVLDKDATANVDLWRAGIFSQDEAARKCEDVELRSLPLSRGRDAEGEYPDHAAFPACPGSKLAVDSNSTPTNPSSTPTNPSSTPTNPSSTATNPSSTATNPSSTATNPGTASASTPTNSSSTPTNSSTASASNATKPSATASRARPGPDLNGEEGPGSQSDPTPGTRGEGPGAGHSGRSAATGATVSVIVAVSS